MSLFAPVAPRAATLKPSDTLAINERCAALIAQGVRVYKLGLGQSPFPVPRPVHAALIEHAHQKAYLPVAGLPELREAIAATLQRQIDVAFTSDELLIGPGSKELLFLAQLVHDGDLLIPAPSWVSYAPQASLLGKRVNTIDTTEASGYRLTPEALDAACQRTAGRSQLLILNAPNNPTGLSYSAAQLEALAAVARRHQVIVLSDEIYGELHHHGAHRSIAEFYPEGTMISGGISKWAGAGGWRLGYLAVPAPLHGYLRAMKAVASETFTSVSAPIQYATVRAYQPCPDLARYTHDSQRLLRALGEQLTARLRAAHITVPSPEGGFYLMPNFAHHRAALARVGVTTNLQLAQTALAETGVAFLGGSSFGRPETELTARLSYVNFDGTAALRALAALPTGAPVPPALLERCCAPTLEAVDRLIAWITALHG